MSSFSLRASSLVADSPGAATDVRAFILAASAVSPASSSGFRSLGEAAKELLDRQPSTARDAVLAFYAGLADLSIDLHLSGRGSFSSSSSLLKTSSGLLSEFVSEMSSRVEESPAAWAPALARWALGVLGEMSTKYTARLPLKSQSSSSSSSGLHESLPLWLECPPPRHLLDLTERCLRALEEETELTEGCISVLLDTSVRHSPHFDWVVAHIGGCFPDTVINRVLNVGLKEFCQSAESQMKKDGKFNVSRVPKLNSIVGILGHLTITHSQDVCGALGSMLDETLCTPAKSLSEQAVGIIPYLLHLASLSDVLNASLTSHLFAKINVDAADRISDLADRWRQRFFPDPDVLLNLTVLLALHTEESGKDLLRILFELASEDSDSGRDVRNGCRLLLDHILCELQVRVHQRQNKHYGGAGMAAEELSLLRAFGRCYEYFIDNFIFSDDVFLRRTIVTLLTYLSAHQGVGQQAGRVGISVVKYCLHNAEDEDDLGAMFEFLRDVELAQPEIANVATAQCLASKETDVKNLLRNIGKILQYQNQPLEEQKLRVLTQFSEAVRRCHSDLLPRLGQMDHLPLVLKIFHFVPLSRSRNLDLAIVFRSARCFSHALFMLLEEESKESGGRSTKNGFRDGSSRGAKEEEEGDDGGGSGTADATDAGPCHRPLLVAACARALQEISDMAGDAGVPMVLRFLLEGALMSKFSRLFGGKPSTSSDGGDETKTDSDFPHLSSLLEENAKFGSTPTHPLGTATVFHAGVIGRGRRRDAARTGRASLSGDDIQFNQFAFLCALFKVCHRGGGRDSAASRDACRHLALLLVEMVSPDVMYNGLPWPEEDFARVTIERDLKITKTFEDQPILWKIMLGLAEARPALCYCSVLIRALMATQVNFWQGSVARKAKDYPKQLATLRKTLELMSVGQFLPHPLSTLSDVIGNFHAFHVHCVLVDVWNFMKDNVPSPVAFVSKGASDGPLCRDFEEFSSPGKSYRSYFERLRLIMIHHVAEIPSEFKSFFVDIASKQEQDLQIAMEY